MIVVVIMAILVAVAVPIFSAVTQNARAKTCAGNRRELVSQLSNYAMGAVDGTQHIHTGADADITIKTDKDENTIISFEEGAKAFISEDVFEDLFQEMPYCPVIGKDANGTGSGVITITLSKVEIGTDVDTTAEITVTCNGGTQDSGKHI
jgi:type II secretory pathway pseudopilin PulG